MAICCQSCGIMHTMAFKQLQISFNSLDDHSKLWVGARCSLFGHVEMTDFTNLDHCTNVAMKHKPNSTEKYPGNTLSMLFHTPSQFYSHPMTGIDLIRPVIKW